MADYCYASITIPRKYIELHGELAFEIERYLDYGDMTLIEMLDGEEEFYEIGECVFSTYDNGIVCLSDSEARWGEFEEIETYCRDNKIPYDRHTRGDWDAECNYVHWFRPDMEQAKYIAAPDEIAVFEINQIKKIIDSQPEDMPDREVIQHLMAELNKRDFNSPMNQITNWV